MSGLSRQFEKYVNSLLFPITQQGRASSPPGDFAAEATFPGGAEPRPYCAISYNLFLDALIALDGQLRANGLQDLHQHDQQGGGEELQHHVKAVVAVVDGNFAQAAAADDTGHGTVPHDGRSRNRHVSNQARHALGHHDFGDNLQRRRTHALGGLDDARIDLAHARFNQARDEGEGRDDQRHNGCHRADGCAHDGAGQRDDNDHQNQERHAAQQVDQAVQQRHDPAGQGTHATLLAGDKADTQRQANDQRQQGGHDRGPNRFPRFKRNGGQNLQERLPVLACKKLCHQPFTSS